METLLSLSGIAGALCCVSMYAAVSLGQSREGGLRYKATRALETFALRRADAVTTICEGLRGDIVKRGVPADKVTVIPNAAPKAEVVAEEAEKGYDLLAVGLDKTTIRDNSGFRVKDGTATLDYRVRVKW